MAEIAFADIYADCKDNVWKLVSRYVFSREDREDLFQEVFLKVHKALPRFRGEAAAGTYVYRIAVNTAVNYLKKQNRYKWLKNTLNAFRAVEKGDQHAAAEFQLSKPLEKLNPRQRMVFLLAEVEDKKLDEIAESMKIPSGTVKSTLHRAREIVKKEVMKNGGL